MVTPYITGVISEQGITYVFWFVILLNIIGLMASFVIVHRYNKLIKRLVLS